MRIHCPTKRSKSDLLLMFCAKHLRWVFHLWGKHLIVVLFNFAIYEGDSLNLELLIYFIDDINLEPIKAGWHCHVTLNHKIMLQQEICSLLSLQCPCSSEEQAQLPESSFQWLLIGFPNKQTWIELNFIFLSIQTLWNFFFFFYILLLQNWRTVFCTL